MIEVGLLGPLQIRRGDEAGSRSEIVVRGRRERRIIAVLALHVGQVVSTAALFDHLWGDDLPRTAHKSLQTAVTNLRRIGREIGAEAWIKTAGDGYQLDLAPELVDLRVFEGAVAAGRSSLAAGDAAVAVERLSDALARWRGDTPADFGDGWLAAIERNRLTELRVDAHADLIEAELGCGHHLEVLPLSAALCESWPLRERLHELHVLALYRAGRQADALDAYQRLRAALVDQGLDPGTSAQLLERRVLDHDPALDLDHGTGRAPVRTERAPIARTLIGREGDLQAVTEALATGRLVTLVGPGGVGKTAMAEHLAAGQHDRDVEWCNLGTVAEPDSLVPSVATALGVDQRVGSTMIDAVCERLRIRPTLLVVDNCEHLLDPIAELVQILTSTCEGLVVLATSRERLSITGETVWPLDGLALPEPDDRSETKPSVALFIERATQSDPHFTVDDAALTAIGIICRGLDGLPLALELAAARVRALPPAVIAKRLDDRFELFAGGRRDRDARHRSLRATVAWSYDLMGAREQRLFRRLGTFAGAFTIEAAEAVAALDDLGGSDVPALLADLVDKSMVTVTQVGGTGRYRLLETLRAFARAALDDAGEREAVDAANIAFHRELVTAMGKAVAGPGEPGAVVAIEGAFDNIRQAIAMSHQRADGDSIGQLVSGLFAYLHFRPRWEASNWAESALEVLERLPASEGAHHVVVAAIAAWGNWFAGDLDRADAIVEAAVAGASESDPALADLLATKAVVLMYRQDPTALEIAADALDRAMDSDRLWLAAYLAGQLAIMRAYGGDTGAAIPHLDRQAGLVADLRNDSAAAWWLYCRAEVSGERDPTETIRLARSGAAHARAARSNLLENITRITAVTVEARHGDVRSTLPEFALLIDRFRRSGAWTHLMVAVWNLVEALAQLGAHEPVAVLLHAAPEGAPRPYGDQLARLDRVRERLVTTMSAEDFAAAETRGRMLTREETAELALDALAAHGQHPPQGPAAGRWRGQQPARPPV